jgi:hypothetical protein
MIQQIKHETGHVQFRVLREKVIGQNSLQLSSSTPAHRLAENAGSLWSGATTHFRSIA